MMRLCYLMLALGTVTGQSKETTTVTSSNGQNVERYVSSYVSTVIIVTYVNQSEFLFKSESDLSTADYQKYYLDASRLICNGTDEGFSKNTAMAMLNPITYHSCKVKLFSRSQNGPGVNVELLLAFTGGIVDISKISSVMNSDFYSGSQIIGTPSSASDVDECSDVSLNHCSGYSSCSNTVGSFRCQCFSNYDDYTTVPGSACSEPCNNSSCSSGQGRCRARFDGPVHCECKSGYYGNKCENILATFDGGLTDWSIIIIAVSMSLLGLFLTCVIPYLIYQFKKCGKESKEDLVRSENNSSFDGQTTDRATSRRHHLAAPNEVTVTIPRPIVIDA